jgi:hypothetical protein
LDLRPNPFLSTCEPVGQELAEPGDEGTWRAHGSSGSPGLSSSSKGEAKLKDEEVVKGQAVASRLRVREILGKVNRPEGLGEKAKPQPFSERDGKRVWRRIGELIHDLVHERAQAALAQPLREGIDRHEAARMEALLVVLFHQLEFGVHHLEGSTTEAGYLSVEDHLLSPLEGTHEVGLVEEDCVEKAPGLVTEEDLEGQTSGAGWGGADPGHGTSRGVKIPDSEVAERGQMLSVFVTARRKEEGVGNGL